MSTLKSPLDESSDKSFWHGYTAFYEGLLPADIDGLIIEFGVFKGNSVRWLLARYPRARIVGVDILPVQAEWPVDPRVEYRQADQGSEDQMAALLADLPPPQLIIEDGSHVPAHQARCLRLGMDRLLPGGLYILEDAHTSLPSHALYRQELVNSSKGKPGQALHNLLQRNAVPRHATALSLLLGLEHVRRLSDEAARQRALEALDIGGHFDRQAIERLHRCIASIRVYRRSTLPLRCYRCGSEAFDYHAYRCRCGVELYAEADSMSVAIVKFA